MTTRTVMQQVFSNFCSDAEGVISTEATFHALFCHSLVAAAICPSTIGRESRHNGGRVDVVVYGKQVSGAFARKAEDVVAAFEFKGGAYGNRNALADALDQQGFSSDLEKLEYWSERGVDAWFVCVDIPSLGKTVSSEKRLLVAAQCRSRGQGFAYFCQGENTFWLMHPGDTVAQQIGLAVRTPVTGADDCPTLQLGDLADDALQASVGAPIGSEDDFVFLVYGALRKKRFAPKQLSLETYFSFAKVADARMQLRPDLCIFDAALNGNFNLYRNGNPEQSNDALKLATLYALFEIKGSVATSKTSTQAFAAVLRADILKLSEWKRFIDAELAAHRIQRTSNVIFALFAFDARSSPISTDLLEDLAQLATGHGVSFEYRHVPYTTALQPPQAGASITARDLPPVRKRRASQPLGTRTANLQPQLFRRVATPKNPRDLAVYFAAILQATQMNDGKTFPLNRFLPNLKAHISTGRLISVAGGYQLTEAGKSYFNDRFRAFAGGPLDVEEVRRESERLLTGNDPAWTAVD